MLLQFTILQLRRLLLTSDCFYAGGVASASSTFFLGPNKKIGMTPAFTGGGGIFLGLSLSLPLLIFLPHLLSNPTQAPSPSSLGESGAF